MSSSSCETLGAPDTIAEVWTSLSVKAVDRVEELRVVAAMAFGERPAVLVGSSFGGQLAVEFAFAHLGLVVGLLLVGPGLSGAEVSPQRRARMSKLAAAARQGGDELAAAG